VPRYPNRDAATTREAALNQGVREIEALVMAATCTVHGEDGRAVASRDRVLDSTARCLHDVAANRDAVVRTAKVVAVGEVGGCGQCDNGDDSDDASRAPPFHGRPKYTEMPERARHVPIDAAAASDA
jgi:hypothetical protein